MNINDMNYHLYTRPKKFQEEAEHERLVNTIKKAKKLRLRKPKTPRNSI